MIEMLSTVYPDMYSSRISGLRPDGLLALLQQNHDLDPIILDMATDNRERGMETIRDAVRSMGKR